MYKEFKKDLIKLFLFGGILYFFISIKSILLPFILGIIIAYLSDGVTTFLEKKIGSRKVASAIIVSLITVIIILLLVIIVPLAITQSISLINELMDYLNKNTDKIYNKLGDLFELLKINYNDLDLKTYISNYSTAITTFSVNLMNSLISKSMTFISTLLLIIITPITTFYFLNIWKDAIDSIDNYICQKNKSKIRTIFCQINEVLKACLKGQMTVCLILGMYYGIALQISGLKYGFFIGLLTGIASFIPYIGMFLGVIVALFVNFYQFGLNLPHLIFLLAIVFSGQFLESNFLTPKLVGQKINLNPLWVIFAVFSGGALFGLVGILFALPTAAVLGVLIRFFIKEKFIEND